MTSKIIENAKKRADIYEARTGNLLPLNVLAKITTIAGLGGAISELLTEASDGKNFAIGALVTVAGLGADAATGGLRGYSRESLALSGEANTLDNTDSN